MCNDKRTGDGVPVTGGLRVAVLEPLGWGGKVLMVGVVQHNQPLDAAVRVLIEELVSTDLFEVGEIVAVGCDQLSVSALEGR
jgi:hypothetical protein